MGGLCPTCDLRRVMEKLCSLTHFISIFLEYPTSLNIKINVSLLVIDDLLDQCKRQCFQFQPEADV